MVRSVGRRPWPRTSTTSPMPSWSVSLIALLRHADRVRIACLAQLVNVIPPIRIMTGRGPAWRQTIFYPFADVARSAGPPSCGSTAGRTDDDAQKTGEGQVQAIEAVAVHDDDGGSLTIFAVNTAGTDALGDRSGIRDPETWS